MAIIEEEIDGLSGLLYPFYDADTHMLYLAGKVRRLSLLRCLIEISLLQCDSMLVLFLAGVKVRELVQIFTSDLNHGFQFTFACFFKFYVQFLLNDILGLFQGDGNIRYYEVITEKPYLQYLTEFRSPAPQKGLGNFRFFLHSDVQVLTLLFLLFCLSRLFPQTG